MDNNARNDRGRTTSAAGERNQLLSLLGVRGFRACSKNQSCRRDPTAWRVRSDAHIRNRDPAPAIGGVLAM
jgi:hypothetical protein